MSGSIIEPSLLTKTIHKVFILAITLACVIKDEKSFIMLCNQVCTINEQYWHYPMFFNVFYASSRVFSTLAALVSDESGELERLR